VYQGVSVPFFTTIICFYIYEIFSIPVWFDEAFTMQQARLPLLEMASESFLSFDAVHFVYYVISHFLLSIIFDSLTTLRFFSFLLTLLTCLNIYKIAYKLCTRDVAVLAVFFYLLLPITFDYATQARSSSTVTFFVSAVIVTLMRIPDESRRTSILKTNLFFGLHIAMNITSVILLPLYLLLGHLRDRDLHLKREFLTRFSFPLVLAAPLVIIAKLQAKQIQWIGSQYSPTREIVTIFLFPFVESQNRYRTWIVVFPLLVISGIFIWRFYRFGIRKFEHKYLKWLTALLLAPSLTLWIISTIYPVYLTRYVTYSAIAFALVLGIVISSEQNRVMALFLSIGIISFSLLNIQNIILYRGSQYNWSIKYEAISSGPKDSVLISSPSWYTAMLTYYSSNDYRVENLNDLEIATATDSSADCNALPKSAWLIGISDSVYESDRVRLQKLGYVLGHAKAKLTSGAEFFSLDGCHDS